MYQILAKFYMSEAGWGRPQGFIHPADQILRDWTNGSRGKTQCKVLSYERERYEWIPVAGGWNDWPLGGKGVRLSLPRGPAFTVQFIPRESNGHFLTFAVDPEEMDAAITDRHAIMDFVELCADLTPTNGFCWLDHEHIVDILEERTSFDSLTALAWTTIVGTEVLSKEKRVSPERIKESEMLMAWHADKGKAARCLVIMTRAPLFEGPDGKEIAISHICGGISVRGIAAPDLSVALSKSQTPRAPVSKVEWLGKLWRSIRRAK